MAKNQKQYEALSTIKSKVKTKLDTTISRYTGEERPSYHLFTLKVHDILYCPECGSRFTTCDPKQNLLPDITHEINTEFNYSKYQALCFKCNKEWEFGLFIGFMENAFDVSFTVEQIADINRDE